MIRKLLTVLLSLIIVIGMTAFPQKAAAAAPTTIGAPEHFGVGHYLGDAFYLTASAPDDMRAYMAGLGSKTFNPHVQIDYKVEGGDWHYTSAWDTAKLTLKNTNYFSFATGTNYTASIRFNVSSSFPDDKELAEQLKNAGWNLPDVAMYFRIRFIESFDGGKTYILSDWSNTYVLSKSVKSDPDALINHAPTLVSAEVKKNTGGQPILYIKTAKQPGEVLDLNSMASDGMNTEIWLRKNGDADFKLVGSNFLRNEYIPVDVTRYFDKTLENYDAEGYEIKIRYVLNDLRKYPQCGRSDIIYSPFSNVYSQNMPAWSSNTSRLSGTNRIETAIAISKEGWPDGADTVILTRDDNYPDALTGTPLSKKLDAPILFTDSKTLTAATAAEIARLKASKVIILGGTGAVSQAIEDKLKQTYEVQRIGGIDRYETAAKIAMELGFKGKAVITTGEDFHDALTVSPLAAYKGIPILLTLPSAMPQFTKDALTFVAPTEITVVGNTTWVSESAIAGLANVKRISGSNIYSSAVTVAKSFGADAGRVFLATGRDFPDALAGSALAAKYNSPIFFVDDPLVNELRQYLTENKAKTTKVHLLGGEGVIPAKIKTEIDQIYQ